MHGFLFYFLLHDNAHTLLLCTKFQYLHTGRQDEEGKQSKKPTLRDLVLTSCPTMLSIPQRKLFLLMLVLLLIIIVG